MKKFLQKSCAWLVALVAMFAWSASAMAQDATFSMSSSSFDLVENQGQATQVTAKGSMTSWSGFAEFNGDGHFLVLECQDNYEITKVVFTGVAGWNASIYASQMKVKNVSEEIGALTLTYEVFKWEGNSKIVRFEQNGDMLDVTFSGCQVWLTAVAPAEPITYTVNFTGGVPDGCYVSYDSDTFTSNFTFDDLAELTAEDLDVNTTDDYYAEVTYSDGIFNVQFLPYITYNVVVKGVEDPAAGVVYEGKAYNSTFKGKANLDVSSVSAANVEGYEGEVTLSGNTFTVTYAKPEYIEFNTYNADWNNDKRYELSQDGVTVSGVAYSKMFNLYRDNTLTVTSDNAPIKKIELMPTDYIGSLQCTSGGFSSANNTWTAADESTTSVTFSVSGWNNDYYIKSLRVFVVEDPLAGLDCSVTVANSDPAAGVVEMIPSYITFNLTASAMSDSNGKVPDGVKLVDDKGNEYTITEFDTYRNRSQVGVYHQAITAAGKYTLTIPKGAILCRGNKYNDAITLEWTIYPAAPSFPEQNKAYSIKDVKSGYYFNGSNAKLGVDAEAYYFTWDAQKNSFTIQNADNQTLSVESTNRWIVNALDNGYYEIKSASEEKNLAFFYFMGDILGNGNWVDGSLGTEAIMRPSNYLKDYEYTFAIEEYVDPSAFVAITDANQNPNPMDPYYYATHYANYAWNVPEGASAFYVTDVKEKEMFNGEGYESTGEFEVVFKYVGDVVPANTGVILMTQTTAELNITPATTNPEAPAGNLLRGVTKTGVVNAAEGESLYKLSFNEAGDKLGFYWEVEGGASLNATAYKAYLALPAAVAASNGISFRFDDTITGIDSVIAAEQAESIYNLQGQRVGATKAGVYVKNGKKFIVK